VRLASKTQLNIGGLLRRSLGEGEMRNIFELTKLEQRIVIAIVTLLVAIALARHFWQKRSEQVPARSISPPRLSPSPGVRVDKSDDSRD